MSVSIRLESLTTKRGHGAAKTLYNYYNSSTRTRHILVYCRNPVVRLDCRQALPAHAQETEVACALCITNQPD